MKGVSIPMFTANGMAVWAVPEEQTADTGPVMASFRSVSHCYKRPVYPDWPFPSPCC